MSVSILYTRLFNLSVQHNYYEDGIARNFRIAPTRETSELLQGGRMLFKSIPKGCTVLYRTLADETTPFVDKGPEARLKFTLSFENLSELLNITDLDESPSNTYKSGNFIYLVNDPASASSDPENPEVLSYELLDFKEKRLFTYFFTVEPPLSPPGDVLLTVTDESGTPVSIGKTVEGVPFPTTVTVHVNEDGNYAQQIDLRKLPKGKYTITLQDASDNSFINSVTFYADESIAGKNVLGLVDIIFEGITDLMYDDTWEYAISFSRRTTIWKYFIVDKTQKVADLDNFNLAIVDQRVQTSPPYAASYTFTRDGNEPHDTIRINGCDTVIFKSNAISPIPFYEAPLPRMELRKVPVNPSDSTQVIIENLPNPSHSGVVKENAGVLESEIYVFI